MVVAVALLAGIVTAGSGSWLLLVAVGTVFVTGLAMALGSQGITLSRRLAYMIREIRAAAKGDPEPPPPPVDLMATLAKPMKAVPKPEDAP